jgi:hypothetical protein
MSGMVCGIRCVLYESVFDEKEMELLLQDEIYIKGFKKKNLGLQSCRKCVVALSCLSVSVEQLNSCWLDFYEMLYLGRGVLQKRIHV